MKNSIITILVFLVALSSGAQTKGKASESVETIVITADTALNAQRKVTAYMKTSDYEGPIGIKLRGNSSLAFNQKKYTLE